MIKLKTLITEVSNPTPKYSKGTVVNYIPKLSGIKPNTKLTINFVQWVTSDNLADMLGVKSKPTWVYAFKGISLIAIEDDIKPV